MKMFIRRLIKRWKEIFLNWFVLVGYYWLLVEIYNHSLGEFQQNFTKTMPFVITAFVGFLVITIIKNRPRTKFSERVEGTDNVIEIKVGDAFSNAGALIIPFNNYFDVSLGGNVKKSKSLQNRLIEEYYNGKEEHLAIDIQKNRKIEIPADIGAVIEIEQNNKPFYLLVNSIKKENNRVVSTKDNFLLSISKIWLFIAEESGRKEVITIPLISSQHGRISNYKRMDVIKDIIQSYIVALKNYNVTDRLIISIYETDLKKGNIDLDEIEEFLKYSCKYNSIIGNSKAIIGSEVTVTDEDGEWIIVQ